MSHTAELEREVLGQLILSPGLFESCDALNVNLFSAGDERTAFAGIAAQWEDIRPQAIDCALLARQTGLSEAWLLGLTAGNYRPQPATFQARVTWLQRLRIGEGLIGLSAETGAALVKGLDVNVARLAAELERARAVLAGGEKGPGIPPGTLKSGEELQAMDVHFEWAIDKLLPARSLTLLHSRGGLGKTWLMLGAAKAIAAGEPFLGLQTKRRPVLYVDFENPLPLLIERVRLLDIQDVKFWHLAFPTPPPKLDGPGWPLYKKVLEPESVIVFDTLRSAHDGDENSSQDAAVIMGRLKEIRELGHEVIAQHHTGKASDRIYKGSTAFADLADHVLDFHRVRQGSLEEIDDEDSDDPDALFSLGTGQKTRFAPFRTFLTFDRDRGTFALATDPKAEKMDALASYIAGAGIGKNQSEIVAWAKEELSIKKRDTTLAILKRGEGSRWRASRSFRGAKTYEPI